MFQESAVQVKGLLQDRRGPTGGAARPAGQTDAQSPETARLLRLPLLLQVQIKFRAHKTLNSTFTSFFNNFLDISFQMDSLIVLIILLKFLFKVAALAADNGWDIFLGFESASKGFKMSES